MQTILNSIFSSMKLKLFDQKICSFLQNRVWLGLKPLFEDPMTAYTLHSELFFNLQLNQLFKRLCNVYVRPKLKKRR